jgi:hypothetical protein
LEHPVADVQPPGPQLGDDEREPGQWPEGPEETWEPESPPERDPKPEDEPEPDASIGDHGTDATPAPEEAIVCPECEFRTGTESSYRGGDPCPECGAWLTTGPGE